MKHRLLHSIPTIVLTGMLFISAHTPVAAVHIDDLPGPWQNFQSVSDVINVLLPNVLLFAGISLFIIILVLGFRMMASGGQGDAEGMAKGKRALTYAIAGFALVFTAFLIIKLVEFLTGVNIFNPDLAT